MLLGCYIYQFSRYMPHLRIKNYNKKQIGLYNTDINEFVAIGNNQILKYKENNELIFELSNGTLF